MKKYQQFITEADVPFAGGNVPQSKSVVSPKEEIKSVLPKLPSKTNDDEELPKALRQLVSGILFPLEFKECHYDDVLDNTIVFNYNTCGYVWSRSLASAHRVGSRLLLLAFKVNNYEGAKEQVDRLVKQFENELEVLEYTDDKGFTIEVTKYERLKKFGDLYDVYSRVKKKGLLIYKIRFAFLEPYEEEENEWSDPRTIKPDTRTIPVDDDLRTQSAKELQGQGQKKTPSELWGIDKQHRHVQKQQGKKLDQTALDEYNDYIEQIRKKDNNYHPEIGDEQVIVDKAGRIISLYWNGAKWKEARQKP